MMFKRIEKSTLFLLLILLIFGHAKTPAQCSCIRFLPESLWLDKNVVYIFKGKVIEADEENYPIKYDVQVTENFRGAEAGQSLQILNGGCNDRRRSVGTEYLFVVSKDKDKLVQAVCSYSDESIDKQEQAIEYFRLLKNPNPKTAIIVGKVATGMDENYNTRKPDAVDKIFAENEKGEVFETAIEPNGIYRFTDLKPGNYKLFLKLPDTLIAYFGLMSGLEKSSVDVEITPEKGAVIDFSVQTNGIIGGRLLDEDKLPVAALEVNLYYLAEDGKEHLIDTEESDDFGNFSFRGLSDGKYFLKTGSADSFTMDLKNIEFPVTYFPNTRTRAKAEIVELGEAQVLGLKNIVLKKLNSRKISIRVLMPDGKPARNAAVTFHFRKKDDNREFAGGGFALENADNLGRFSFKAFKEADYFIEAYIQDRISESNIKIPFAGCVIINDKDKISERKIVLEKDNEKCDPSDHGF